MRRKPNSQFPRPPALRSYSGLSVDSKRNSLKAFQRQGSVSHEVAKVTKVLNPQSQNRDHFDRDRNENHEKIDLREHVLESRFSLGSPLKTLFEGFPVSYFHLFRRPVRRSPAVRDVGESVLTKANAFQHPVTPKSYEGGSLEKNVFSFVTSCLRVKQVLNAFRRSDRSAWTKADLSVSIRVHPWFKMVLNAFYNPCKSVLFAPPPPREPKLLPLPAKISFSVPEPFVVMNVLNSPQSASISVNQRFKNVFAWSLTLPLFWRLIPVFSTVSPSVHQPISRLASFWRSLSLTWRLASALLPRYPAIGLFSYWAISLLFPLHAETIPQRYPLDRYNDLRKHLPFGKPTVIETEAPKPPPFTEDLTLLGFSKVGSGYFVTLANKKNQQKIFLSPKEKPDGITVAEVLNNSEMSKVEIKLKKGNEIASVKFDPKYLAAPSAGNPIPNLPPQTVLNGLPPHQPPLPAIQIPPNANSTPPPPIEGEGEGTPHALNPQENSPTTSPNQTAPIRRIRRVNVPPQVP